MGNVNVSVKCKEKSVSEAHTQTRTCRKNRLLAVMASSVQPRDTRLKNWGLHFQYVMRGGESKINIINRGIDIMCLHRSGSVRKKTCCGTHSGRAERNRLTEKEMVYFFAEIFIWHTFPAPTVIDLRFILSQSSQISNKLLTVLPAWNVSVTPLEALLQADDSSSQTRFLHPK